MHQLFHSKKKVWADIFPPSLPLLRKGKKGKGKGGKEKEGGN